MNAAAFGIAVDALLVTVFGLVVIAKAPLERLRSLALPFMALSAITAFLFYRAFA